MREDGILFLSSEVNDGFGEGLSIFERVEAWLRADMRRPVSVYWDIGRGGVNREHAGIEGKACGGRRTVSRDYFDGMKGDGIAKS